MDTETKSRYIHYTLRGQIDLGRLEEVKQFEQQMKLAGMLLPESVQCSSMSWRPQQCISTPDFTIIQWKLRLSQFGMRRSDTPHGIVQHEDDTLRRQEREHLGREHGEE